VETPTVPGLFLSYYSRITLADTPTRWTGCNGTNNL